MRRIKNYFREHKFTAALIILVLIVASWRIVVAWTGTSAEMRYVLARVAKGTIISSVSGTGQVSTANQIEIKAKAAGEIIAVGVRNGQAVSAGGLIAQLDSREAQKIVRDAEANLVSAQITLEKAKRQSASDITLATQDKVQAVESLKKTYEEGYNAIVAAFLDLPEIITGLDDILGQDYLSSNTIRNLIGERAWNYRQSAERVYYRAKNAYQEVLKQYKISTRQSETAIVENLISETYEAAKLASDAAKELDSLLDYVENNFDDESPPDDLAGDQTTLHTYNEEVNDHLVSLLAVKSDLAQSKNEIKNTEQALADKITSLNGSDPLEIQAAELALLESQNNLTDARETLADYDVRAPLPGLITQLEAGRGDSVSAGTVLATLITSQKFAEISLNEIDAAKVALGDRATLTFDAVENLEMGGVVEEIDLLGTVTSGVVTYNVKISFDPQPARQSGENAPVKSGMSASADIVTETKSGIILVPNSAIKVAGQTSYVEMFDPTLRSRPDNERGGQGIISPTPPRRQTVTVGLANDQDTEIVNGLKEGDEIVVRTIAMAAPTNGASSDAPSFFGRPTSTRRP